MSFQTGWFGVPGGGERTATKTHIVRNGKPVCGTRLGERQQFQWCAHGIEKGYVECRKCLKAADSIIAAVERYNDEYHRLLLRKP